MYCHAGMLLQCHALTTFHILIKVGNLDSGNMLRSFLLLVESMGPHGHPTAVINYKYINQTIRPLFSSLKIFLHMLVIQLSSQVIIQLIFLFSTIFKILK
jgi:hypothetical protein